MTNRQRWAIQKRNEDRVAKICEAPTTAGIYCLYRVEEGIHYIYVGQAKNLRQRLAQHLSGYTQHIDKSIRKRGLYAEGKNDGGWDMWVEERCAEADLDEREKHYIRYYANRGFQLYNATIGGQGEGKKCVGEGKSPKGYREGVEYGEKKAWREVRVLFDKYLDAGIKGAASNIKERKLAEFLERLKVVDEEGNS